jgi:hypothetical protein
MALDTVAEVPDQAGVPGEVSGLQRRQGRNPSFDAAAAVLKKVTFSDLGSFTGQTGRQYIPVVFTPTKNCPSKRGSRDNLAFSNLLTCWYGILLC